MEMGLKAMDGTDEMATGNQSQSAAGRGIKTKYPFSHLELSSSIDLPLSLSPFFLSLSLSLFPKSSLSLFGIIPLTRSLSFLSSLIPQIEMIASSSPLLCT